MAYKKIHMSNGRVAIIRLDQFVLNSKRAKIIDIIAIIILKAKIKRSLRNKNNKNV
jgi:hypothetical protein